LNSRGFTWSRLWDSNPRPADYKERKSVVLIVPKKHVKPCKLRVCGHAMLFIVTLLNACFFEKCPQIVPKFYAGSSLDVKCLSRVSMARCLDWFSWALTVQLSFGQLSIVVFLTLHSSSMHNTFVIRHSTDSTEMRSRILSGLLRTLSTKN